MTSTKPSSKFLQSLSKLFMPKSKLKTPKASISKASKSKSSIVKIRKKLEDIKPLPSVKKSKIKKKMVLKRLPIKIQDIKNILNIPFNKIDYNNITIKSLLYDKYTSDYKKNLELLREQLEQGRYWEDKEYYNYLDKIRTHLNKYDIYNMARDVKNEDSTKYYNELKYLLSTYDPLNMSSEQLIKLKNCLYSNKCITWYNNIIIYEFAPTQIKQSLTGSGAASKEQVQTMVKRLFPKINNLQTYDASDAVAISLCGLWFSGNKLNTI